jgi:hypothetical protein
MISSLIKKIKLITRKIEEKMRKIIYLTNGVRSTISVKKSSLNGNLPYIGSKSI